MNGEASAARLRWLAGAAEDAGPEPPRRLYILATSQRLAAWKAGRALGLKANQWRFVGDTRGLHGIGRGERFYITDTFWERDDAHELYNCATENRQMVEVTSEELEAMRREAAR